MSSLQAPGMFPILSYIVIIVLTILFYLDDGNIGKRHNRGKNMAALIQEEQLDEDGQPTKVGAKRRRHQAKRKAKKKPPIVSNLDEADDDNDEAFSASDSDQISSESSQSESSDTETVSNDEVCNVTVMLFTSSNSYHSLPTSCPRKWFPSPAAPNQQHTQRRNHAK